MAAGAQVRGHGQARRRPHRRRLLTCHHHWAHSWPDQGTAAVLCLLMVCSTASGCLHSAQSS
jgi:hypothetical protein